jgi:hypothetical protein
MGFSPARVFPKDAWFWIAATGDLRGHGLPALGCGKLLDLSVQESSWLERDVFPLTGCPLEVMRLCADDMLDELDGIAVAWNFAWITCNDVQDDVLETTVGLATSRKVPLGGRSLRGSPLMRVDISGVLGEVGCDSNCRWFSSARPVLP